MFDAGGEIRKTIAGLVGDFVPIDYFILDRIMND